ncbi:hypothetical protein D039_2548B, partial [Vibrio parahaemolyticus EKP-028]|jgi:hypothetical protein
LVQ